MVRVVNALNIIIFIIIIMSKQQQKIYKTKHKFIMLSNNEKYRIYIGDDAAAANALIKNQFPIQQVTRLNTKSTAKEILQFERQVQINLSSIKSTLGGGLHGYLGFTMRASRYERISDSPFPDDRLFPDKKRKLQV